MTTFETARVFLVFPFHPIPTERSIVFFNELAVRRLFCEKRTYKLQKADKQQQYDDTCIDDILMIQTLPVVDCEIAAPAIVVRPTREIAVIVVTRMSSGTDS